METFAQCRISLCQRQHESLTHVIRMNVVNSFHSYVWNCDLSSARERGEGLGIEVPGWIDRIPSRSNQVARMKHGDR